MRSNLPDCPHCGQPLVIIKGTQFPPVKSTFIPTRTFETSAPWQTTDQGPSFVEATRTRPARNASFESDVLVPFVQCLITGLAAAVPGVIVTLWLRWAWYSPLIIWGLVSFVTWLSFLGAHRKALWIVETITNFVDDDNDNDEDQPAPPKTVKLEVTNSEAGRLQRMKYIDLPSNVAEDQFYEWAKSVTSGSKTPARRSWVPSVFTDDTYRLLMLKMTEAGILVKHPGKGYQLTNGGKRSLLRLLD